MKNAILGALVAVLLLGAYHFGTLNPAGTGRLEAQGRGPVIPPKPRAKPPTKAAGPLMYGSDSGVAAANNGFMAVTGSYGVGTSVLYIFDTINKQLLVYEARGGSPSMRRLVLVGARRIDLDLQLIDYNDESEYKRSDLDRLFRGGKRARPSSGVTVPGDLKSPLGTGKYRTIKKTRGR